MPSTPPFVAQERPDSCAIACLRMLLAQKGVDISEDELVRQARLNEGGLNPEEIAALARANGLPSRERMIDDAELAQLVEHGRYPIVILCRRFLDGEDNVHAVIPIGFAKQYVTLLDPLCGKRRISIRKLAMARNWVQRWAIVEEPSELA